MIRRTILVAALALTLLGACGQQAREPDAAGTVSADGIALASVSETLPAETETLPPGPGQDVVAANCTACHSSAMIAAQPPLTPAQWEATVKKMREVYHAPVAATDVPAILKYLNALSARRLPAAAATPAAAAP